MTNAEKIAKFVLTYGSNALIIHTIPGTQFWLTAQKRTKKEPWFWKIILCDPNKTTRRIISEKMSNTAYESIWEHLLKLRISHTLKIATQELRKEILILNKHNKNDYKLQSNRISSKNSSTRHSTFKMDHESARPSKNSRDKTHGSTKTKSKR